MIETYGWSPALQRLFEPFSARGLEPGRVIVQQRGAARIVTRQGELAAELSGRFLHEARPGEHPVAGDWVAAALRPQEGAATVHAVLPRASAFKRRASGPAGGVQVAAANADVALLVGSLNADLNLRRLERYLAAAWESGARPVLVLTKLDLCADPAPLVEAVEAIAWGAPVLALSATTGEGMAALAEHLKPAETAVLLGSSGVGKSTLVNALVGGERMATGDIREDDARGRHTTTHRELILSPDGVLLLDTPGMRELGLWEAEAGLSNAFHDVEALAGRCRFRDCGHGTEPGCAVQAALADGTLDPARWRSYGKLQREIAFEATRQEGFEAHAARERARRFHRGIVRANRARKKAREAD